MPAPSLRARVRAELVEEIKAAARRRLATDGPGLTLRAVARDLEMVPSALYRYFDGRDALLTALITDAYDELGAAAEAAEAAVDPPDLRARWMALCRAVRHWALAHPAEYALLYGTPVPGYAAPADTAPPASRVVVALVRVAAEAQGSPGEPVGPALHADLDRIVAAAPGPPPDVRPGDRAVLAGLAAWSQLFGLVSFEVFGRLAEMFADPAGHFDHQMQTMADLAGLP
ncbi:TetR/AcrR family transcriptional regulator [Pseudonocardia sp. DLS-67]